MNLLLKDLLNPLRVVIKEFTFTTIKDIAGLSGLPISELAHLQQKTGEVGASKGQLIDAIEDLLNRAGNSKKNEIVIAFIKVMCREKPEVKSQIEDILNGFNWELTDDNEPREK